MLRLLALGGAAIIDNSRDSPGPPPSQRRTLALLSALAVGGPVGLSRDKLVALFWPEADSERGRHALTQALYASRRGLRCDDLFIVNGDVRLNPARITSDIGDLESALDVDDERAVAIYRGPFLDGFFLPGAAEFERWASIQRARIEEQIVRALEHLADAARDGGDQKRASDWWKRAAGLRPLDSRVALRLMETLAAAGDRAGAIQHAAIHTALLHSELELGPDTAVAALAQSLREAPAPGAHEPAHRQVQFSVDASFSPEPDAPYAALSLADTPADKEQPPRASEAEPLGSPRATGVAVWVPERRPSRSPRLPLFFLAATVLVAIGVLIGRTRRRADVFRPVPLRQKVVVAPFRVAGAASSLAYLRDGMVELLSTRLADDSSARAVDAGAVLGAWRAAGLAPAVDVPRDTVVDLAAHLGAERVVVGGVIGTPGRVVIRATVLRVPSGAVSGQATVEGSADSITALVDRLAVQLLVAEAGEEDRLGNHVTSSLPALRAYLAGQAAFRRSDYTAALRQYETSLQRDSTFGLAALRLATVADRIDDILLVRRALRIAWRSRNELTERDRAMLLAFAGARYPAPSFVNEQAAAWHAAADLAPQSAETWFALGARLFHDGDVAAVPDAAERAATALQRALVVDSNYAPAARLLEQLAAQGNSAAATSAAVRRIALDDSLSPFAPFLRWRMAVTQSDTSALRSIRSGFSRLGPANLRAVALASQFDAVAVEDGTRALRTLRARSLSRTRTIDELLGEHAMALNEGRIRDALDATTALGTAASNSHADLRLRVLDRLYGDGDTLAGRTAAENLEREAAIGPSAEHAGPSPRLADLCVLAQWRLATGNAAAAAAIAVALRNAASSSEPAAVSAGREACAELVDAAVAVASRRRDARARVARLDSMAFTPETAGDAAVYAPLWIARLHEQVGDVPGALRSVRRRQYMSDWPRYLASMLRVEGRLAETVGEIAAAREAYRRYLVLRHTPDAPLTAQAVAVRQAADRLASISPR